MDVKEIIRDNILRAGGTMSRDPMRTGLDITCAHRANTVRYGVKFWGNEIRLWARCAECYAGMLSLLPPHRTLFERACLMTGLTSGTYESVCLMHAIKTRCNGSAWKIMAYCDKCLRVHTTEVDEMIRRLVLVGGIGLLDDIVPHVRWMLARA
jgi:hypothetical protein